RRTAVRPVVLDPSLHHRIDLFSDLFQGHRCPLGEPPAPYGLANGFNGLGTNRRGEAREDFSRPAIPCLTRSELVSQKVELRVLTLPGAVLVFTVDDLGLFRMKSQFPVLQTLLNAR